MLPILTRFVYVICVTGGCKIGVATNPALRIANLQTGSLLPYSTELVEKVARPIAVEVEHKAREILVAAGYPKVREWIAHVPPQVAAAAVTAAHARVRKAP
jgi:hypothetical protein